MTKPTKKGVRRRAGDVVTIPLGDGEHAYSRVLNVPLMAFYDFRDSTGDAELSDVLRSPVLFKVWVDAYSVTTGRWPVVGHAPLEPELETVPDFYIQDALKKDRYFLYRDEGRIPTTREACVGLERASVWGPEHIEERLRDHFAGRPNKWVESRRLK